jgi:NTP pyrophosphatase (non-canonical NTP hydrolase)
MREDLLPTTLEGMLSRLVEETGEVLQVIGKIQRFGLYATDPKTGIKYDNATDLRRELADLRHALWMVEHNIPREKT